MPPDRYCQIETHNFIMTRDSRAREDSHIDSTHGSCLTFSETATRVKQDISSFWRQASVQEWYEGNSLGSALIGASSRRDEAILTRLRSGHTRVQWTRDFVTRTIVRVERYLSHCSCKAKY
ncbi:catalase [Trichonephila clavipes]|nr:catalase [Trichonephila clavipes]